MAWIVVRAGGKYEAIWGATGQWMCLFLVLADAALSSALLFLLFYDSRSIVYISLTCAFASASASRSLYAAMNSSATSLSLAVI